MEIEITTNANAEDKKRISQGIIDFNHSKIPDLEPIEAEIKVFVFSRNALGEVTGGIRAICYWNTLHIELLWLSEDCRGQGTGRKLIASVEKFAKQKGCEKAFVETTSWQAKPFYEKVGYMHIATINNRPKGHSSHFMTKNLM